MCHVKHLGYLGFLLCFPLKDWKPAAICYIIAHFASIVHIYMTLRGKKDRFAPRLFSEEELMTLFAYVAIAVSGTYIRVLLYTQLIIWTVASTCEWLDYILERNPNFPILCALIPLLDFFKDIWVDVIKIKSHIEVSTMFISCVGWIFGLNAPLLPVIYT